MVVLKAIEAMIFALTEIGFDRVLYLVDACINHRNNVIGNRGKLHRAFLESFHKNKSLLFPVIQILVSELWFSKFKNSSSKYSSISIKTGSSKSMPCLASKYLL